MAADFSKRTVERENKLSQRQFRELLDAFLHHVSQDVWTFLPVTYRTLQIVGALCRDVRFNSQSEASLTLHD
jgi:hypothetical protein